ncbi:Uma2 family endonuclease [Nibrella saemangeumensis]|uniref:Uma2 family endonuclease n=1 Tax=Nibrella saemangeumensis TaxID=1084526 RepID=A0ABP8MC74_9BACT
MILSSRTFEGPGRLKLPDRMLSMTEEEFFFFCQENPDFKFERDPQGNIIIMALTGGNTGKRNSELLTDLNIWNRSVRSGVVFDSSTGFKLPNGAIRSPDAAWVSTGRWQVLSAEQQDKFPPVCPDFVVELMSDSDNLKDATGKMQEYLENGCRLAWLINPKTEQARVYRPDGSVQVVQGFDNQLADEDVLPGFTFDLNLLR